MIKKNKLEDLMIIGKLEVKEYAWVVLQMLQVHDSVTVQYLKYNTHKVEKLRSIFHPLAIKDSVLDPVIEKGNKGKLTCFRVKLEKDNYLKAMK